jgi:beta-1,4-mannooligosaccharide/beta-1,4-mannosyl-N-acetylglucosamine phosphorylase
MLRRNKNNPIITRDDIGDVTAVFNPGAIKVDDKYLLMLRVQLRSRVTVMMMAQSDDGINFSIDKTPINFQGIENLDEAIYHVYDPRITKVENGYFVMFAMDLESGCKLGLAFSTDMKEFEFVDVVSDDDNRNGVMFPEKIGGQYFRLDRPNQLDVGGVRSGDGIWLSISEDSIEWQPIQEVAEGNWRFWDELIGAGPPPVKTDKGWLLVYHGVATHYQPIYQVGVMLLDLEDPTKVIARGKQNILEPRELYETVGQVPNVVFPTGMIVEDERVLIYYGAADTSVCVAETTIEELINACY